MSVGAGVRSVVIVEDHAMVAEALAAVLSEAEGLEVVAVAPTVAAAIEAVARESVDVVLADFRLPDGDGADVTAAVRRLHPDAAVIVLTAAEQPGVVRRAIAAGANGFLHKSEPISEVVRAIRAVADGDPWFPRDALAELVGGTGGAPARVNGAELTRRELEVLQLLASGASTQAIVETLVLSTHTVRNHVRNVMAKLGAHSKLEAVTIAASAGLVEVGR